ncbi:GNAT family N-acetyltransferase [Paraflavitalea sp. CAU 1676]|uniref:GNAT family N-acetyltransferase n=1 Tax=Paraflavitalea sp. CAU 1676 TaxID=3032598 RepID=UPI0023DAD1F8|nr:GNAT family N-acetyltransferase [Paraflavitalea sp. CAU 1676]MDF2190519.1 GNAT family N-acetyltransferase [Paraflavitalea sp. CAU 1676]
MIEATIHDKDRIVQILARSFENNKSVNYVLPGGSDNVFRIKHLMDYSFNMCFNNGNIFLSEDKDACVLTLYPHKSKYHIKRFLWDLKLIFFAFGISQLPKVLKREKTIAKAKDKVPQLYIWFIGVDPSQQRKGIGSKLLKEVLLKARAEKLPIYLETSTLENIPWYLKHGFDVYHTHDFTYRLFFLKTK